MKEKDVVSRQNCKKCNWVDAVGVLCPVLPTSAAEFCISITHTAVFSYVVLVALSSLSWCLDFLFS